MSGILAGRDFAEDGDDLVARDEFLGDRGGFTRLGLVILGEQFQFAAEHAPGGVDFLDGLEGALVRGLSVGRLLAGQRRELANLDRGLGKRGVREQGGDQKCDNRTKRRCHG
jgi:hypothetical protein